MNINTTLEKLERKAAERQEQTERNYCKCFEPPIIRLVPVSADGTHYEPTDAEVEAEAEKHRAEPGEICPRCGKPYRPGTMKEAAVVIGGKDER